MFYIYKCEPYENFMYWSNSLGELHHNGEYDIENVNELPEELQRAYNDLFCDGMYGVRVYLSEFNNKYGISFSASYDDCYANDLNITYKELVMIAKHKAIELSEKYSGFDILFGEDSIQFSDGSNETEILIFMPWNITEEKFDEVGEYFSTMCYSI